MNTLSAQAYSAKMSKGDPVTRTVSQASFNETAFEPSRGQTNPSRIVSMLNPLKVPNWDELVSSHPQTSIFHTAAWAKVLSNTYHHIPNYMGCLENGELRCLLPIMEVNSWLTGRRGVSLPFSDFCEPLTFEQADSRKLLESAIKLGRVRRWNYFEWRGRGLTEENVPAASFITHTVNLTDDEDALFARIGSKTRNAIRKAEKLGVRVRFLTDLKAVRSYYQLHSQTRRRHGLPPQPFSFFQNIHEHVISKGLGFVALAHLADGKLRPADQAEVESGVSMRGANTTKPITKFEKPASTLNQQPFAGAVYFHFGKQALYKFSASDEKFQEMRGNNLIMWRAIQWFRANGYETLHLGRTSPGQKGLQQYKLGFGAREQSIEYFKYDLRKGIYLSARDLVGGRHNRLFRSLPSLVNRCLGVLAYRHLHGIAVGTLEYNDKLSFAVNQLNII